MQSGTAGEGGGYQAEPCEILALERRKAEIWDFEPYKAKDFSRPALRLAENFFSMWDFGGRSG